MQAGDVVAVASRAEAERALDHFRRQGIADILVQEHVDGPVVKFYGVGPGGFLPGLPFARRRGGHRARAGAARRWPRPPRPRSGSTSTAAMLC